jgi:hypothetical protein
MGERRRVPWCDSTMHFERLIENFFITYEFSAESGAVAVSVLNLFLKTLRLK